MCVQASFADIYLRGMRERSMRSGTEFVLFVVLLLCCVAVLTKLFWHFLDASVEVQEVSYRINGLGKTRLNAPKS